MVQQRAVKGDGLEAALALLEEIPLIGKGVRVDAGWRWRSGSFGCAMGLCYTLNPTADVSIMAKRENQCGIDAWARQDYMSR
jgi:hypothetical protein